MKSRRVLPALTLMAASIAVASAQTPSAPMSTFPTTRILAIGHLTTGITRADIAPIMKDEVPATVRLYLAGKIDQWYFQTEGSGVVFILNVTSKEEAHALLEKLPLGQHKMMEFDLIPLGPLAPLQMLLQNQPTPKPSN